jgi:regulator of cell morphogenesis and NO signaling
MSNHETIYSPIGTPLLDRTVGELVAERPGRSRVFQSLAIDFCCQGGRSLREACERKGITPDLVVRQIEAESEERNDSAENPANLPVAELISHIVAKHHGFLKSELPRLHAMSERVANVHGEKKPSLVEVFQVFCSIEEELTSHMMKEEEILFPAMMRFTQGEAFFTSLDGPIFCMIHEHEEVGSLLSRLRELTDGFTPPHDACNTYRALFAGLGDLEEDLHRHIHLENTVLFPAAQAMIAGKSH